MPCFALLYLPGGQAGLGDARARGESSPDPLEMPATALESYYTTSEYAKTTNPTVSIIH